MLTRETFLLTTARPSVLVPCVPSWRAIFAWVPVPYSYVPDNNRAVIKKRQCQHCGWGGFGQRPKLQLYNQARGWCRCAGPFPLGQVGGWIARHFCPGARTRSRYTVSYKLSIRFVRSTWRPARPLTDGEPTLVLVTLRQCWSLEQPPVQSEWMYGVRTEYFVLRTEEWCQRIASRRQGAEAVVAVAKGNLWRVLRHSSSKDLAQL